VPEIPDDLELPGGGYDGPDDVDPFYDPEYEKWAAKEIERGELAFAPNQLPCPYCENTMRTVTKLGPVGPTADPTQSYVLECGHVTI